MMILLLLLKKECLLYNFFFKIDFMSLEKMYYMILKNVVLQFSNLNLLHKVKKLVYKKLIICYVWIQLIFNKKLNKFNL